MKVVLTGAAGFLGWHTRVRLLATTNVRVLPVTRESWPRLGDAIAVADAVVHVAGINRGTAADVETGNLRLAEDVAAAIRGSKAPTHVVFANSIQAGDDTPYGIGKQRAAEVLEMAARASGGHLANVCLPNLFGEHGRPRYNSFVATFVDSLVRGEYPHIDDRPLELLHAQDAAQSLIDGLGVSGRVQPKGTSATVQDVYDTLAEFDELYRDGDVPPLTDKFGVDLFNTLRSGLFPRSYPRPLESHADERGWLVEAVRAHGGQGQTFVSSTKPGVTRGEHFHLSKVERFVVVGGRARISLRRLFHEEVVSFDVTGEEPAVVDMPTMWVHNIVNTGDTDVTTLFWTHSLFDPEQPDTYPQAVLPIRRDDAWC